MISTCFSAWFKLQQQLLSSVSSAQLYLNRLSWIYLVCFAYFHCLPNMTDGCDCGRWTKPYYFLLCSLLLDFWCILLIMFLLLYNCSIATLEFDLCCPPLASPLNVLAQLFSVSSRCLACFSNSRCQLICVVWINYLVFLKVDLCIL